MNAKRLAWAGAVLTLWMTAATPAGAQSAYCSDITKNTTWGPDKTHVIGDNCTVNVRNATLTVSPGTLIQMGKEANLVFQAGSNLVATSYVDSTNWGVVQVIANSREDIPGYWGQIRFEPGSLTSSMKGVVTTGNQLLPVVVSNGGFGGVPMVDVRGGILQLEWIVFQKALEEPLGYSLESIGPSLELYGQMISANACQYVQITNNGRPGIQLHAEDPVDVDYELILHHFCVPYFVDEEIVIAGQPASLKIDAGITMLFGPAAGIVVGTDADNPGQLDVAGTAVGPILLSGQEQTPGSWKGIVITEFAQATGINNAAIAYGGRDGQPMVTVLSPDTTAWFVEFRNAKAYPLTIAADAVSGFTSALAIVTGEEPPPFADNGVQAVQVLSKDDPVLGVSSAWGDLGVPSELAGSLIVAGASGPRFSVLPGAELRFPVGAQLVIGSGSEGPGELSIKGEEDRPAILTSSRDAPGSWKGILIDAQARSATIDRAIIENGGAGGPMVDWRRVAGDLTRVTFRNSAGYPVSVPVSMANDVILSPEVPDEPADADLRSTFEGNAFDRILVVVDRSYTTSLSDWSDPGAPVEFSDSLQVTSPTQPLLTLNEGLRLLFRPGKSFDLGDGASGRGSLLVSLDDPTARPITIGPVEPAQGWSGLRVRKGGSLRATGPLSVTTPGEGAAAIDAQGATVILNGTQITGQGKGTGLSAAGQGALVTIENASITNLAIGLRNADGAELSVTKTVIDGNAQWGLLNDDPESCLTAPLVFWGSPLGPLDPSDVEDGCLNGSNVSEGDKVSDDVDWWPYATNSTTWTPSGGLGPNPWKVFFPYTQNR